VALLELRAGQGARLAEDRRRLHRVLAGGHSCPLVDLGLGRDEGGLLKAGEAAGQAVDKCGEFGIPKARLIHPYCCAVSASKSSLPTMISRARERPARAGSTSIDPPPGHQPGAHFPMSRHGPFPAGESQVTGERELAARDPLRGTRTERVTVQAKHGSPSRLAPLRFRPTWL
jgi:hypothetical protein